MKKSYTREKKTLCGEGYMEIDLYHITPEEHRHNDHHHLGQFSDAAPENNQRNPCNDRDLPDHRHRWLQQIGYHL